MHKPIHKPFDTQTDFPLYLVYKDTKSPQRELPDHQHQWYEIVYVYHGMGTFFIDQSFYEMQAGDVFIIPGNTIHRAVPDKTKPVTSTALFFSPALVSHTTFGQDIAYLDLFDTSRRLKIYQYKLEMSEHRQQMEQWINMMKKEEEERKAGFRNAMVLSLHMILLTLTRNVIQYESSPAANSAPGPIWMKHVLVYIDQHLEKRLSLHELARLASISPEHFSRVFKQWIGMTITDYITAKRMNKAQEMLKTGDHKVNTIAMKCGYESMPHFYRTFKKHTGLTPAAWRKKQL